MTGVDHVKTERELERFQRVRLMDAKTIVQEFGNPQVQNLVMMGAFFGSGFIELRFDPLKNAARSVIPERHLEVNLSACRRGRNLVGINIDPG